MARNYASIRRAREMQKRVIVFPSPMIGNDNGFTNKHGNSNSMFLSSKQAGIGGNYPIRRAPRTKLRWAAVLERESTGRVWDGKCKHSR
jgi:hypothetical protein